MGDRGRIEREGEGRGVEKKTIIKNIVVASKFFGGIFCSQC